MPDGRSIPLVICWRTSRVCSKEKRQDSVLPFSHFFDITPLHLHRFRVKYIVRYIGAETEETDG